jgi:putative ABC transport system permease protein
VGRFAAGLPIALLVTRVLSKLLVGVSPADPATYLGVVLVLGHAGLVGRASPARKAMGIDPLTALRTE